MSFFDDVLAADAEFFVDGDIVGGESATYYPKGGTARTITVLVQRRQFREVSGQVFEDIQVSARNHATYGISLAEYNQGGDEISIAPRKGGTAKRMKIIGSPRSQDAGMISFGVA